MAKLTIRKIESLKPGETAKEYADGHIPGLYIELRPSGKASWVLRYRHGGKTRKLLIGPYPGIGLAKARDLASKRRGEIADQSDPAAEKRDAKIVDRTPTDHLLVERVVEQFVERYCKTMLRTWAETERLLKKEIVGRWKGRPLADIGATHVITMLDEIVDRGAPIAANRTLAAFRRMCHWAVGRKLIAVSPCTGIEAPSPERSSDRVLNDAELKAVWLASGSLGWPFQPIVRLLLLTGQRRDEIASMRWSEIDFATKTWTIPKERCKNNQAHVVPLAPQSVGILEGLPRIGGVSDFVFTSNGTTPGQRLQQGEGPPRRSNARRHGSVGYP
jgi:integrase